MSSESKLNEEHYFLDKNQVELERLDLGQAVIKHAMKQQIWAPIDFSRQDIRILDSAGANGIWAEDLRASLPTDIQNSSTFIVTDITDVFFPVSPITGIRYQVQSMLQDWPEEMAESFDLVHQRMALPAANRTKVRQTLRRFMELIKPGGWIQLVEADHSVSKGPAMADFFRLLSDIFAKIGTGTDYARQLKDWLPDLGFEDVQEKIFDIPLGLGNEDETMKSQSSRMFEYGARGLIEVGRTIPTSFNSEELDGLERRIREENLNMGGIFRIHCVWGRKPLLLKQ
ncbi:hypothetical protein F5B22DRAFT_636212 [Xylaria bambusicola]|uniref:uncharacterized protein n=1 Tax=Xylaria bambusicola TaxID=326684 RepID=UPI0020074677|nr:uncharacterized protein F5B22DRAFT_636212 [Xylaria bambusicola]KAI0517001.1 hypothetical protein F5B22DRAFT_636212 [Xylaria bambusicola]